MALRVLLADESATIKKVFQLTLQDYGVEVRTVNVGIDVLHMARKFQPDIIFTDLLLQKRSGYDVSLDLKQDPELKNIPVVIMRSGFMELDEDKYTTSKANAHLEKPFDVSHLRKLITHLVPKTQSQDLSKYLSMPEAPEAEVAPPTDFMAPASVDPMGQVVSSTSSGPADTDEDAWNIESFNPITTPEEPAEPTPELILEDEKSSKTEWVQQKVSRFKVDLDDSDNDLETALPVDYVVPGSQTTKNNPSSTKHTVTTTQLNVADVDTSPKPSKAIKPSSQTLLTEKLTEEQFTEIIHNQSREMIEAIVWKIVPDLAKQIIEKEIERLIKEKI